MSGVPVLMIASVTLSAQNQSQHLPDIPAGAAFWAFPEFAARALVAAGQATVAPPGTPPPGSMPWSVNGVPGLGRGTSNSSR